MPNAAIDFLSALSASWSGSVFFQVMMLLICIILILVLSDILDTFPMSLGCFVNWKECVHLFGYASNKRKCRFAASLLSVPFIFLAARFCLHPLSSVFGTEPFLMVLGATTLFLAYLCLRLILTFCVRRAVRTKSSALQAIDIASSASNPFFMLCTLLMISTALIFSITGLDNLVTRHWLLWEMAVFYSVFIIRKFEIFASYRGFFAGFLYLCTLEIIPSTLLVLSARL